LKAAFEHCRVGKATLSIHAKPEQICLPGSTLGNVKNLKLAYAVPLGGTAGNESVEATPLVENGVLHITDSRGVLYKIDSAPRDVGRIIWRMDPKQKKPANNRGATLGQSRHFARQLAGAHHRDR
jgi:glucose dehydrogenase